MQQNAQQLLPPLRVAWRGAGLNKLPSRTLATHVPAALRSLWVHAGGRYHRERVDP